MSSKKVNTIKFTIPSKLVVVNLIVSNHKLSGIMNITGQSHKIIKEKYLQDDMRNKIIFNKLSLLRI